MNVVDIVKSRCLDENAENILIFALQNSLLGCTRGVNILLVEREILRNCFVRELRCQYSNGLHSFLATEAGLHWLFHMPCAKH